ncbi:MAG TPA: hypothetical protein VGI48_03290 [Caldimonas sp.]|jgi:hypothetical protein
MANEYQKSRWYKHMADIDREIARHAVTCKVALLDPGVIERVLENDSSVCGTQNQAAFDKMRALLMMHYSVRERTVVALGQEQTMMIVADIVARLRERLGDKLGGTPGA